MFIKSDSKLISLEETRGVDRIFSTVYIESRSTEKQSIRFRTEGIAEAFVLDFQNYLNAKTASEKSDTGELIAKYSERLNQDLEADLNLEEFLNSHSFLEQRVNFHGLNHGIDIQSVEKKVVDYLEAHMGYFLDPDRSAYVAEHRTIDKLVEAIDDIDDLLLRHVIDYMQSENKVAFFSDRLYKKSGETILAPAIVLTERIENYKVWVEGQKKQRLGGCALGCLIGLCIAFILLCIILFFAA